MAFVFKQALCIKKSDVTKPLSEMKPFLIPRFICEEDSDFLQIIPYIVIVDNVNSKVLSYTRGSKGDENRLHNATSIGFGGHVEVQPTPEDDLLNILSKEASREVKEEICQDVSESVIYDILSRGKYHLINLHDSINPVDRVHLGLMFTIHVDGSQIKSGELDVILDPVWLDKETLQNQLASPLSRLEAWSRHSIEHIDW